MTWIKGNLGDLTTILSGTTPKSEVKAFWNGAHTWITPTDLGKLKGFLIQNSERTITDEGVRSSNLSLIPIGSVVMSSRAPIGHLGIAGKEFYTNQGCKSFVCGPKIDGEFLYFTLLHRMKDIQELGSGATFVEVSKSALQDFEISYPDSIKEQRQIASQLKSQLAEVEKARKAVEEQIKEVHILLNQTLAVIFSELDFTPKHKIGDFAETTSGSTPSRSQKNYWEPPDIPWIKTGEVAFRPITKSEEYISNKALEECSLRLLPMNSVLVAMYGQGKTRGQSAILKIEGTINQACFAILPNETWEPEFLYLWLRYSYQKLRELSADRGGNQANLNGSLMNSFEVPAPPKSRQKEIVNKINISLEEITIIKERCEASLIEIGSLYYSLLSHAFKY